MYFLSFSCLLELAQTSSITLSKSDGGSYPCLFPDFKLKAFTLLPLRVMLSVGVSKDDLYQMKKFPTIPDLLGFFLS